MRRQPARILLASIAILIGTASSSYAATVRDAELGFTLELPQDFAPRPDMVGIEPNIIHAFQFGEAGEGEIPVVLFVEKLGGTIGRERLREQDLPADFEGERFLAKWQGFDLDCFEIPETLDGIAVVTYNVQIPLKKEGIQIKLFGPADRADMLDPLFHQVLAGLQGKSNWLSSSAPPALADSENYTTILLSVAIGAVVLGLVGLWFLSRVTPRGTVLAIAAVLYIASWQIEHIGVREVRLACGIMRMLGFTGGILGVIDAVRKRKPKEADKTADSNDV